MLTDSSKTQPADEPKTPQKWWHIFRLRSEWGIVMGILVGIGALLAPVILLDPVFAVVIPMLALPPNISVALASGVIMLGGLLVIAAALAAYNKKFSDIGLDKPKLLYVANAVVALIVYIGVSMALQVAVKAIFGDSYNAEEAQELGYTALTGVALAIAGICLVILAPFTEEVIFRGFMYRGLRRQLPFWLAAFVVSAIFGLVHGQLNVGLDVFAMSLISCYLVEKTGSLWPSIFLHVLKNAVAFCIVYLYNGA